MRDGTGRKDKSYLPAAGTAISQAPVTGVFGIQNLAAGFYIDYSPYSHHTYFGASDRVKSLTGPGNAWHTAGKKAVSSFGTAGSLIRRYSISSNNAITLAGTYPAYSLISNTTTDEQGNVTIVYKDKRGQTVQSWTQINSGNYAITHYIYDEMGRIRAVIQPEGYELNTSIAAGSAAFTNYVFCYEYDSRGRPIRKHVPGAGWTEIVYDKANRPVMTQNAAQKTLNRWSFTQYDAFERAIAFGETVKNTTRATAQTLFNSYTVLHETWTDGIGYSELSFPVSLRPALHEVEKYHFYDNYGFIASEFAYKPAGAFHTPKSSAKGLLTGVSKRNSRDDSRYYTDIFYYDDLNRTIQSQHTHQKSTGNQQNVIVRNMEYNFSNEVTKIHTTDPMPTGTVYAAQHNFYDHAGRITRIDYGINTSSGGSVSASSAMGGTTPSKSGMYSLGFSQPANGVPEGMTSGLTDGFTMPTLTKLVTYSYDEIGRMTEKRFMPDGTYSLGNPDYIYLPPNPSGTAENKARKAVILEPGTLIEATNSSTYLAGIDSTVSDIPPFTSLQRQRYSWHIRGGLRGINLNPAGNPIPDLTKGDLFAYKLDYETAGQWNGNIGRQSWNHVQGTEVAGVRNYQFTFDSGNRLKSAIFSGLTGENYSLPAINYDRNGNITQLQRSGKVNTSTYGLIDNLSYSYSGNRLTSVSDAVSGEHEVDFVKRGSGGYTYYENGALKSDENKEITNIIYNTFSNLPSEVQLTGGRWIKMTYDGSGALIKREFSTGEYWEYANGIIFKNEQFFSFSIPEGRAVYENETWQNEFFYGDHLQNTRVTFRAEGNRLVKKDATDFEPFGTRLKGTGASNNFENRRLYQDKESLALFGLENINDFGPRYLDRSIGRFMNTDPLSSGFPSWSPYHYLHNSPLNLVDPTGMFAEEPDPPGGRQKIDPLAQGFLNYGKRLLSFGRSLFSNPGETISGIGQGVAQGLGNFARLDGASLSNTVSRTANEAYGNYTARLASSGDPGYESQVVLGELTAEVTVGALLTRRVTSLASRTATTAAVESSVSAVNGVNNSSNILLNTSRQLQAKFKHARDFGVVGNYSKANAAKFSSALNQHINASGTQVIQGVYRNASNPVTFYLNPQTGLNVIASPAGQFISGAALSTAQVQGILTKRFLW